MPLAPAARSTGALMADTASRLPGRYTKARGSAPLQVVRTPQRQGERVAVQDPQYCDVVVVDAGPAAGTPPNSATSSPTEL